jgi:hypothetical protein
MKWFGEEGWFFKAEKVSIFPSFSFPGLRKKLL